MSTQYKEQFSERWSKLFPQIQTPNVYKISVAMFVCINRDQHLCTHTVLAKAMIMTHGHFFCPQECVHSGVCYYDLGACAIKKNK